MSTHNMSRKLPSIGARLYINPDFVISIETRNEGTAQSEVIITTADGAKYSVSGRSRFASDFMSRWRLRSDALLVDDTTIPMGDDVPF